MPDPGERTLCSEKIFVPPSFPSIMKGYCKAAIRTQPYDLLRWSAAYFRALANGENPPVKERLEFPPSIFPPGLTPGYLRALVNQLGKDPSTVVTSATVAHKWGALCLPPGGLDPLLSLLGGPKFPWLRFLAIAAGSISTSLTQSMILICELLTEDPEGGKAAVPVDIFLDLYQYLAYLDCGPSFGEDSTAPRIGEEDAEHLRKSQQPGFELTSPSSSEESVTRPEGVESREEVAKSDGEVEEELGEMADNSVDGSFVSRHPFPGIGPRLPENQVAAVAEFMRLWAGRQDGMVMPRNIRHWMCPPLDNCSLAA